ncbi:MAG: ABC transporter permease [Oscillospiraceae bacterium]|nr:ABC transporter permease [Oscillospiraceae bacterium]
MFLHNLKYEMKAGLRNRELVIWLILFPMFLGTVFKIAFGSIYEKVDSFSVIPCAVVEDGGEDAALRQVLDSVSEGEDALLKVQYVSAEEADDLLREGEVSGILTADGRLSLTVTEEGLAQTVLRSFAGQYNTNRSVITDSAAENPQAVQQVIESLRAELSPVKDVPLTKGNTDYMVQYFTNLLAMVAMYGSLTGLHITIQNQGNLSKLGARKCCSPTPKSVSICACLTGSAIMQTICMVISVSFLSFILKIRFGGNPALIYLTAILGGLLGVAFGFCIGSIGRFQTGTKTGICFGVSMFCCFCSGLMVGNMKSVVARYAPWFNRINPAALITDSLYYLNIDSDYQRYAVAVISMAVLSAVLILLGFILTRRKKYASL